MLKFLTLGIKLQLETSFFQPQVHSINNIRELKMETFLGRRRPDWQRKPGTEAAIASRQKLNIKIAVNSEGRRL